ncbi:MAG: hypothetical protein AVDCRST_MAG20-2375 [uncultured Acidimicrobiales bacterium]|uniref:VOC domain-containing protein n=1 Tax=uncultured Acidimicrobiales bacterium TaxID=310071 RepID=A0A6J4IJ13_9ACTN|nr:MAG: hypothetical protein AVDCRST_MAG20-2375 [uncultured Acidimicrobiales bacterium]
MPTLVALTVLGDPRRWRDLGFSVEPDGSCQVGAVRLQVSPPEEGGRPGIDGWSFAGLHDPPMGIDGIPTEAADEAAAPPGSHPNGVTSLDHVVVTTPDLGRTVAALEDAGLRVLRERDTEAGGRPMRQVFLRPGEAVVEVVGPPAPTGGGKARFFGLAFTVADLDATAALLGDLLGAPKVAVQPGRRIATVRSDAGLGVPVAFMSAEPTG